MDDAEIEELRSANGLGDRIDVIKEAMTTHAGNEYDLVSSILNGTITNEYLYAALELDLRTVVSTLLSAERTDVHANNDFAFICARSPEAMNLLLETMRYKATPTQNHHIRYIRHAAVIEYIVGHPTLTFNLQYESNYALRSAVYRDDRRTAAWLLSSNRVDPCDFGKDRTIVDSAVTIAYKFKRTQCLEDMLFYDYDLSQLTLEHNNNHELLCKIKQFITQTRTATLAVYAHNRVTVVKAIYTALLDGNPRTSVWKIYELLRKEHGDKMLKMFGMFLPMPAFRDKFKTLFTDIKKHLAKFPNSCPF